MNVTRESLTTTYLSRSDLFGDKVILLNGKVHLLGSFPTSGVYRSGFVNLHRFVRTTLKKFIIEKNNRVFYISEKFIFDNNKKLIAIKINNIFQLQFGHFIKKNELEMIINFFGRWESNYQIEYVEDLDGQYMDKINFNVKTLSAKKELETQILDYVRLN